MQKLFNGFIMSLGMFSIIPVPSKLWNENASAFIIPTFPLVGAIIGGLWYLISSIIIKLDVSIVLQASIIILIPLFLSGFIHIDGYMDTCDAIFSRANLEKKRSILKDCHVGAFAVIALTVFFILNFSSMYNLLEKNINITPFIIVPILSRAIVGMIILNTKPIYENGFVYMFKKDYKPYHNIILIIFVILCLSFGYKFWQILVSLIIFSIFTAFYCIYELKGISGDLSGFILTLSELFTLIFWSLFI